MTFDSERFVQLGLTRMKHHQDHGGWKETENGLACVADDVIVTPRPEYVPEWLAEVEASMPEPTGGHSGIDVPQPELPPLDGVFLPGSKSIPDPNPIPEDIIHVDEVTNDGELREVFEGLGRVAKDLQAERLANTEDVAEKP